MSDKEKERIQQRIYLSRKSLNSLEFEYEVLRIPLRPGEETSFELLVINHGEPTHVHFSLSREIRDKVMIMKDKVYVIEDEKVAAIVRLPKTYAGAVETFSIGEIYVSSGYGASKRGFAVEIVEAKVKEAGKEAEVKEEEQEAQERTEKKDVVRSPDERELLAHLATSACAVILFAVLLMVMRLFSQSSPALLFVNALIASLLFLFIVIYNL
jgi:cation transport ATPase